MENLSIPALLFLLAILCIEIFLRPRVDKTRDGKTLLWYGRRKRRYIVVKE